MARLRRRSARGCPGDAREDRLTASCARPPRPSHARRAIGPLPPVALFGASALFIALTAGFGLGLWLLLARVWRVTLFGADWLALVQVHGVVQLFGFVGLMAMGIGLDAIPRFRGALAPSRRTTSFVFAATTAGVVLRAVAQPAADLVARDNLLFVSGVLLVAGTGVFAFTALRSLAVGRNPHRADELLMGAGIIALPLATLLVVAEMVGATPVIVERATDDRAVWVALLASFATLIFGVWARVAPGFIASPPPRPRALLGGGAAWLSGVALFVADVGAGVWLMLVGLALLTHAVSLFGPSIARQPLSGHARLTRIGVRSAFIWAFVGTALLTAVPLGIPLSYVQLSAVRHAFALGFVTLMIYAVGSRVLPAFLGRRPWSIRSQQAILALANLGVAARVAPQVLDAAAPTGDALVGASGLLAYAALVVFVANVVRTIRGPGDRARAPGAPVPIELRLSR